MNGEYIVYVYIACGSDQNVSSIMSVTAMIGGYLLFSQDSFCQSLSNIILIIRGCSQILHALNSTLSTVTACDNIAEIIGLMGIFRPLWITIEDYG